jgi:hypothetical protein
MKWLHTIGCPWDARTFTTTAYIGNLANMMWLSDNGCPLDTLTFAAAEENKNPIIIDWLQKKYPVNLFY